MIASSKSSQGFLSEFVKPYSRGNFICFSLWSRSKARTVLFTNLDKFLSILSLFQRHGAVPGLPFHITSGLYHSTLVASMAVTASLLFGHMTQSREHVTEEATWPLCTANCSSNHSWWPLRHWCPEIGIVPLNSREGVFFNTILSNHEALQNFRKSDRKA